MERLERLEPGSGLGELGLLAVLSEAAATRTLFARRDRSVEP